MLPPTVLHASWPAEQQAGRRAGRRESRAAPDPLAQSLEDLAALAAREGQAERALRLLGAAEAFCETVGLRPPVGVPEEYTQTVTEGRAARGEAAFSAAWTEGRSMSLEEALAYALSPG